MAITPVSPFVLKDVELTIAGSDYRQHVDEVRFSPSVKTQTWKGLGGNTHTDQGFADWSATVRLAQDMAAGSLWSYLMDHEGETVSVTFAPISGAQAWTSDVTLSPTELGGGQGAFATGSATMGCTKPQRVVAGG